MLLAAWLTQASSENGDLLKTVVAPIAGTGIVGALFLMVIFKIRIMPTYVHEDAKAEWVRERAALEKDVDELKSALREANSVYTGQVIPTLTRALDAERELVDLRREEQRERERQRRNDQ